MKKQSIVRSGLRIAYTTAALAMLFFSMSSGAVKKIPDPIERLLARLEVGRPVTQGLLTVVPVYAHEQGTAFNCVTLEEALKQGWLEITELDGGRVPQVRMSNLSKFPVFIMGGEILTGCRQDRILAQDLLIGPGRRDLVVPVYCVEQGRWSSVSESFTSKSNLGTHSLRARAYAATPSAQSEIWDKIREQNQKLGIRSGSDAFQAAYEAPAAQAAIQKLETHFRRGFKLDRDVIGVVIGLGDRVVGVDIFADARLFEKQWPKILRSSALSCLQAEGSGLLTQSGAADFLRGLQGRNFRTRPALDLGFELVAADPDLQAGALVFRKDVLHLAGFPREERRKVIDRGVSQDRLRVIR